MDVNEQIARCREAASWTEVDSKAWPRIVAALLDKAEATLAEPQPDYSGYTLGYWRGRQVEARDTVRIVADALGIKELPDGD